MRQVLALRDYRQQILSADIANASTPGFKAVDLDFKQALAIATGPAGASPPPPNGGGPLRLVRDISDPGGSGTPSDLSAAIKYQVGNSVSLDGNSVSLNQEKATAAENAVQYEAAATFASQIVKMLSTAINGFGATSSGA
jgi:flagellar basal-body rod protein FlgB